MSLKSSSFKKKSYSLKIEDECKGKKYVDNLGFISADEPKLMEFIMESRNGVKNKSKDYSKGWHMDDHEIPLEMLMQRYATHPDWGLTNEQIKKNLDAYGPNVLFPPKSTSEIIKFLTNVLMGLNLLLWISGVISIITFIAQYIAADADDEIDYDNLTSGASLVIVVFVAGSFAYYQEFQSSRIIDSFKNMVPQFTVVWREGRRQELDVSSLVVGDIVEVKYGDRLPADIRIIDSQGFKVDNSSLTGEAEPQKRNKNYTDKDPLETQNLAFFSTNAVEGSAKGVVVRTGGDTFMGNLAALASQMDSTSTPIAKEMYRIIIIMTTVSLVFGAIFFGVGLSMHYSLMNTLFFVIGIVIANVPENLNVTLTIILALTAQKLAAKNCVVKHLHAVETLGSASVICSDKTGTLTQNKMSVAHMWFSNKIADADTSEFATTGFAYDASDVGFRSLANVAILCSRARFKNGQSEIPILKREVEGDASETAILKCMELQFGNVVQYREGLPKVCEIPFNSSNKFQVSIHNLNEPFDPRYLLVMKGAPERIVAMCTTILVGNNEYELDDKWRKEIDSAYTKLGSLGERVLGFCDCRLPIEEYPPGHIFDSDVPDFLKVGFRFVGLISMIDPPRATVPLAVSKCRQAGIRVVMITGDHPITAKAIARAVGIISPENLTIEEIAESYGVRVDDIDPLISKAVVVIGSELACMNSDELDALLMSYEEIVFARTSPEQKYLIVDAFQRLGNVVAVTGDGVNDSPALKKADIGIAMGVTGTDVAKEVADLVLMDDNFATILNGVEDGRLIFDNLKKLIRYTFADNVAEMYSYWVFIILKVPLPMGTLAMLLSTLAIDMGPAISLAHEHPESDIMKLKPRDPNRDTLVTAQVLSYSYGQVAVIECSAGFLAYFVTFAFHGWMPYSLINIQGLWDSQSVNDLEDSYGQEWAYSSRRRLETEAQTAFFAALVLCQWANALACKTRRLSIFQQGLRNNFMNLALCLTPCIACLFIYTDGLNTAVSFEPLRWESWVACLPFAIFLFVYDEFRRLGVRMFPGGWFSHEFSV